MNPSKSQELEPDLVMAERFLNLLDEGETNFTFQCYPDNDSGQVKMAYGSFEEHVERLTELNQNGSSICVTVNKTDNKGREKKNVIGIRAVFRENDRPGLPQLPEQPHLMVETSPGKFHEYYFVEGGVIGEWPSVQQRLVDDYGSDPNAKDLPRVLRVPGFYHQKAPDNPFMISIVRESGAHPFSWDYIKEIFPPVPKKVHRLTNSKRKEEINSDEIIDALSHLDPDMEYGEWLKIGMALGDAFNGNRDGLDIWVQWSKTGSKYRDGECEYRYRTFSDANSAQSPDGGITINTLFKMANDTGWRWKSDDDDQGKDSDKESVAQIVIKTVTANAELKHDADDTPFVVCKVANTRQLWPLESKQFKNWLGQQVYKQHGIVINKNTLTDVLNTIGGIAIYEGEEITVHIRTAAVNGSYHLDLCREDWSVVEIKPGEWCIVDSSQSVYFRRTSAMRPLPHPVKYGFANLPSLLGKHINMPDDEIRLLIAYLIESLMADTEYPILELTGSPGSGKSTAQEMIRDIIAADRWQSEPSKEAGNDCL